MTDYWTGFFAGYLVSIIVATLIVMVLTKRPPRETKLVDDCIKDDSLRNYSGGVDLKWESYNVQINAEDTTFDAGNAEGGEHVKRDSDKQ